MRKYLAEAIGTFAPIIIGMGAIQNSHDSLTVALACGVTVVAMTSFLFGKSVAIPGMSGWTEHTTSTQAVANEAIVPFFSALVVYRAGVARRAPKTGELAIGLTDPISQTIRFTGWGSLLKGKVARLIFSRHLLQEI